MELNYEITEKDYVDFNLFHAKNSKAIQKQITIQRLLVPVIYLLLAVIVSIAMDLPFLLLFIPLLIVSIGWFFYYPAHFYRTVKRNAGKMMKEGKNKGVLGEHTMIFTDEGLREISPKGEMTISWSGIEQFGEAPSGFYLYNSGMSALIIPKRELKNIDAVSSFLAGKIGRG